MFSCIRRAFGNSRDIEQAYPRSPIPGQEGLDARYGENQTQNPITSSSSLREAIALADDGSKYRLDENKKNTLEVMISLRQLGSFVEESGARRAKPSQTVRALSDLYVPTSLTKTRPHIDYLGSKQNLTALVDEMARQLFIFQRNIERLNGQLESYLSPEAQKRYILNSPLLDLKLSGKKGETTPVSQLTKELGEEFNPSDWNNYELSSVVSEELQLEMILANLSLNPEGCLSRSALEQLNQSLSELGEFLASYTPIDQQAAEDSFGEFRTKLCDGGTDEPSLKIKNLLLITDNVRDAVSCYFAAKQALIRSETERLNPDTRVAVGSLVSEYTRRFPQTFDCRN